MEHTDIEGLVTTTAFAGVSRRTLDERDHSVYRAYYFWDDQRPTGAPSDRSHALYLEYERTWRTVDDLIAPRRGFVLGTHWGGGPPGVSTKGFGRALVQFAAWQPLGSASYLKLRMEGGAVIADSREGIPSALLFRTGGDTTVRGYEFESLGVDSGDATVGGRYFAIASVEAEHSHADWGSPPSSMPAMPATTCRHCARCWATASACACRARSARCAPTSPMARRPASAAALSIGLSF
jgi:translocation and assembly module TamA